MVARDVAQAGADMLCAKTSIGCVETDEVAGPLDEDVKISRG